MNYCEFIKNKRVVLVGPSPILHNRGMGEYIDDFDIVVKTNGFIANSEEKIRRDYGSRIDVICFNMQYSRLLVSSHSCEIKKLIKNNNILPRFICVKALKNKTRNFFKNSIFKESNTRKIQTFERPSYFDSAPFLGTLIINDILMCNPASLNIIGFDFYCNTSNYNTIFGYQTMHILNNDVSHDDLNDTYDLDLSRVKKILDMPRTRMHKESNDLIYMMDLYNSNKIIVDDTLKKIFNHCQKINCNL